MDSNSRLDSPLPPLLVTLHTVESPLASRRYFKPLATPLALHLDWLYSVRFAKAATRAVFLVLEVWNYLELSAAFFTPLGDPWFPKVVLLTANICGPAGI